MDGAPTLNDAAIAPDAIAFGSRFEKEASHAFRQVSESLAGVISGLPASISKESDLRKAVGVDKTLSWQVYTIANSHALRAGVNVPGSASMQKFLKAAGKGGAPQATLDAALRAYENFEQVVERHAGDRTSFNSMLSAVSGTGEDEAVDLLHRRNMFRAISHFTGTQVATVVSTSIFRQRPDGEQSELCALESLVGLRLLRPLSQVKVFEEEVFQNNGSPHGGNVYCEPLIANGNPDDFLIDEFSTKPRPTLSVRRTAQKVIAEIENVEMGKTGAMNLTFGVVFRNLPLLPKAGGPFRTGLFMDWAAETFIHDLLVPPGLMRSSRPACDIFFSVPGTVDSVAARSRAVPGNFHVLNLGRGPSALATNDVPNYPETVRAAAGKLGWNVENYDVWRIHVSYPMFNTSIRMQWQLPPAG